VKRLFCATILFLLSLCLFATTAPQLYQKGQQAQAKEDWYTAIESYQEALKVNPAYGEVWYALAQCSYATSQYELTLSYLDSAEKFMSNNTNVLNLRGFAFIGMGKVEEARTQFLQVLNKNPNDIQSRFGLGELDILNGKYSGAEQYYTDALKREGQNRKALLALALLSDQLGDTETSSNYIKQALKYHSGSAEVHYFAGYIAARENDLQQAEGYLRTAILLNGTYDKAYSLLAGILYEEGRYQEAIDICDYRISINRNVVLAWYLKGLSYRQMNEIEKAVSALTTGLEIAPRDEELRAALEMIMDESLKLEDSRRKGLSDYHAKKGKEYYDLFYADQAKFEYLVALHLNPENTEARLAYANILLHDGYNESYLSQLEFIQTQGKSTQKVDDEIEAWQSILQKTISKKWGIDPLYLDKTRWNVELFYTNNKIELIHAQVQEVCARRLVSYMRSVPSVNVSAAPANGFSDAFKQATENKQDFFVIINFQEAEREITVTADLYSAKSGNKLNEYTVYRTGNDRFSIAILKLATQLSADLPQKGLIIDRNVSNVLIDLGKRDGASSGDVYTIIKKDSLYQKATELGLTWKETDVLGTLTVASVGEEISEASVQQKGYYDVINIDDEIVLKTKSNDTNTQNPVNAETTKKTQEPEEKQQFTLQKQIPVLYNLIQSISN
jgi:tetratricopeptide (TPR) repeat protein